MKTVVSAFTLFAFLASSVAMSYTQTNNVNPSSQSQMFLLANIPPGLANKGFPKGLQRLNKTPYGWSQGKKTGWYKTHHTKPFFPHRGMSPHGRNFQNT